MTPVRLAEPDDFEAWRTEARALAARGVSPQNVAWTEGSGEDDLFADAAGSGSAPTGSRAVRANRPFLDLARSALLHRDPARLALLYRVLWRLQHVPDLLEDRSDSDVLALHRLAREVRRDVHKMRAFVRFRQIEDVDGDRFVAWFEPEHRIERYNARFFIDRFANQRWTILTSRVTLDWNGSELREGPGASRADAPSQDAVEELWRGYYRSIFNPARLKIGAMLKEMPRKYWKNLPEAREINSLVGNAQQREAAMITQGEDRFAEPMPDSLAGIGQGIEKCRRCPIGCNGTRAVMGEGPADASLMILGEQPGDQEEASGSPFVGPAGQVLSEHLADAGIDRSAAYLTNAVKHFKFTWRGKRRLHQTPTAGEIDMCRWWLGAERAVVRPRLIVALGASAGRALLGRTPSIARERGQVVTLPDDTRMLLTAHPSYLLRLEGDARQAETARFRDDLAVVSSLLP